MTIHTVLGPVEPELLTFTSMHEHLFLDARSLFREQPGDPPPGDRVSMETLGWLRWNMLGMEDNLVVDDEKVIVEGLRSFRNAGGNGLVDMTNIGLGRQVERLPRISRATDVHIMIGSGWYRDPAHPPEVSTSSVENLSDFLVDELDSGVSHTGIRPALIGEIGTSSPVTPNEKKVLAASARAAALTGAAINVHLEPAGQHGPEIVELLVNEGADPTRVILSHLDERPDLNYHLELAKTGIVLEYDTFGMEAYWDFPQKDPTDSERFRDVAVLLEHGLEERLVLGCDVFCKTAHSAFGGMGYEHLPKRVVPALVDHFGVTSEQVQQMLTTTPRRLLDR